MTEIKISVRQKQFLALLFASGVGIALLVVRIIVTRRFQHLYLPWNLLLAWIPWIAATLLDRWDNGPGVSKRKRIAAIAVWFLFFPNAPYIFTDLVHLGPRYYGHYWIDMLLILLVAVTGLTLGFLSLQSMHRRVTRHYRWPAGWLFVIVMSLLSGAAIYAGRFLRWNSWDVIARPGRIVADAQQWVLGSFERPFSVAFPLLCGLFLFVSYLLVATMSAAEPERRLSS